MKVSYKPALLNGLKLHTEIGKFCDKKIQLNSGGLRSRLKLMAAATYQPNAITSVKYQLSRINAKVYDHQIQAKLSIPLSQLSLKRSAQAHCSVNGSEVQENVGEALNNEQDNRAVVPEVDSDSYVDSDLEESSALQARMSTAESLQPVQHPIPSWFFEMKNVFSEKFVQCSDEGVLHSVEENVVNNIKKLEQIIPNANLTFFSDPTWRGQYGDFSKPDNYLSNFIFPITDSICSLVCYELLRDNDSGATFLNLSDRTKGYLDHLVTWYTDLSFYLIRKNLITIEAANRFFGALEKIPLINEADSSTLETSSRALSWLADKYTASGYKNIFLNPKKNLFIFSEGGVPSPEFVSDFCKKRLFLLAKKILIPGLNDIALISKDSLAINRIDELFDITYREDGTVINTSLTLGSRDSVAASREQGYRYGTYRVAEQADRFRSTIHIVNEVVRDIDQLTQNTEESNEQLVKGLQEVRGADQEIQRFDGVLERLLKYRDRLRRAQGLDVEGFAQYAAETHARIRRQTQAILSGIGTEQSPMTQTLNEVLDSLERADKKKTDSDS